MLLSTFAVAALPDSVQAADFIWSGCGDNNNWNNPENWSVIGTPEDALPGFFDNVIFGCIDAEQGCFECNPDKDCVVTQEQLMFNLTVLPEYAGRISFQGSLASWDTGGDAFINGGEVSYGTRTHTLSGDFIVGGGTIFGLPVFVLTGTGEQTFDPGPAGITVSQLSNLTTSELSMLGDITIRPSGAISLAGPTTVSGTVTLDQSQFSLGGPLGILTILDGAVLDAISAESYRVLGGGVVIQDGSGRVLKNNFGVGFTFEDGTPRAGSQPAVGEGLFVTLFDEDENIVGNALDVAAVTVESLVTGDLEILILTETGVSSEEFRNVVALPTVAVDMVTHNDGFWNTMAWRTCLSPISTMRIRQIPGKATSRCTISFGTEAALTRIGKLSRTGAPTLFPARLTISSSTPHPTRTA